MYTYKYNHDFLHVVKQMGDVHDVMTMKRLLAIKRLERNLCVKPKLAGP